MQYKEEEKNKDGFYIIHTEFSDLKEEDFNEYHEDFDYRKIFLRKVIDKFCLRYNKFIEEGFLLIREDYIRRAEFLNTSVTVRVFDKEISGIAEDITEQGALKIVDKNNTNPSVNK